jgi:hypothetical protein
MDLNDNNTISSIEEDTNYMNGVSEVKSSDAKETNECIELKHIQYKSMIQTGISCSMEYGEDNFERLNNLEKLLETKTDSGTNDGWNKLDMTVKMQKVNEFVNVYKEEHSLDGNEADELSKYIRSCLDKKKLIRVKDVEYNVTTGKLVGIPGLHYNKTSKKYTIKNADTKKASVLSRLPQKKKTLKKTSSVVEKETK